MALTPDEIQVIVNQVISAIRTNSRTIESLSLITSLGDDDCLEISGGKRISYGVLKLLLTILFTGKFDDLQTQISKLRKEFDALVGENASEAIDNFNEICAFLEGIKDSETLLGKLAEVRLDCDNNKKELQKEIDSIEERISPNIYCKGFLNIGQSPSEDGIYLQKDSDGDPIQIVTKKGDDLQRAIPEEGILYTCNGKAYVFNGIMLTPTGHAYFIFDGGKADSTYGHGSAIGGGNASTDFTFAKRIDGGKARFV